MSKLALKGGEKLARELEECTWPVFDSRDEKALLGALRNKYWGGIGDKGSPISIFEDKFSYYHDAEYGLAVANGTVSLELALRAGKIKPGDEVIVPAITFIASASAVISVGAVPRFADVEPETCQISVDSINNVMTEKTRAIIVVHYGSYIADMDAITAFAEKENLLVIEDCAHGHGASWRHKKVGSWGDFGSFSFQQSKALSSGEGGMVITNNDDFYERASLLRNIGRRTGQKSYNHYLSASNWRLSGLQGALLLSQLKKFKDQVKERDSNARRLEKRLASIPGIKTLPDDSRITQRGYYFLLLYFEENEFGCSRENFISALKAEGVTGTGNGYARPLYREPAFKPDNLEALLHQSIDIPDYPELDLFTAEDWARHQVTIPHYYLLGNGSRVELIFEVINKVKQNVDKLS